MLYYNYKVVAMAVCTSIAVKVVNLITLPMDMKMMNTITFTDQDRLKFQVSEHERVITIFHSLQDCEVWQENIQGNKSLVAIINGKMHFGDSAKPECFNISNLKDRIVLTISCPLTKMPSGKIVIRDCSHQKFTAYYDNQLKEFGIGELLKIRYWNNMVLFNTSSVLEDCDLHWNTSQGKKDLSVLGGGELLKEEKLPEGISVKKLQDWNVVIINLTSNSFQDVSNIEIKGSSRHLKDLHAGLMILHDSVTAAPTTFITKYPDSSEDPVSTDFLTAAPTTSTDSTKVEIYILAVLTPVLFVALCATIVLVMHIRRKKNKRNNNNKKNQTDLETGNNLREGAKDYDKSWTENMGDATSSRHNQIDASTMTSSLVDTSNTAQNQVDVSTMINNHVDVNTMTSSLVDTSKNQVDFSTMTNNQVDISTMTNNQVDISTMTNNQVEFSTMTSIVDTSKNHVNVSTTIHNQFDASTMTSSLVDTSKSAHNQVDASTMTSSLVDTSNSAHNQVDASIMTSSLVDTSKSAHIQVDASTMTSSLVDTSKSAHNQVDISTLIHNQADTSSSTHNNVNVSSLTQNQVDVIGSTQHGFDFSTSTQCQGDMNSSSYNQVDTSNLLEDSAVGGFNCRFNADLRKIIKVDYNFTDKKTDDIALLEINTEEFNLRAIEVDDDSDSCVMKNKYSVTEDNKALTTDSQMPLGINSDSPRNNPDISKCEQPMCRESKMPDMREKDIIVNEKPGGDGSRDRNTRFEMQKEPKEMGTSIETQFETFQEMGTSFERQLETFKEMGIDFQRQLETFKEMGTSIETQLETFKKMGTRIVMQKEPKEMGTSIKTQLETFQGMGTSIETQLETFKDMGTNFERHFETFKEMVTSFETQLETLKKIVTRIEMQNEPKEMGTKIETQLETKQMVIRMEAQFETKDMGLQMSSNTKMHAEESHSKSLRHEFDQSEESEDTKNKAELHMEKTTTASETLSEKMGSMPWNKRTSPVVVLDAPEMHVTSHNTKDSSGIRNNQQKHETNSLYPETEFAEDEMQERKPLLRPKEKYIIKKEDQMSLL